MPCICRASLWCVRNSEWHHFDPLGRETYLPAPSLQRKGASDDATPLLAGEGKGERLTNRTRGSDEDMSASVVSNNLYDLFGVLRYQQGSAETP